jgi:hypothetical protein
MKCKRIREPREYRGVLIVPVCRNSSGIRWCARPGIGVMLKSDTLAGIKELIRYAQESQASGRV